MDVVRTPKSREKDALGAPSGIIQKTDYIRIIIF